MLDKSVVAQTVGVFVIESQQVLPKYVHFLLITKIVILCSANS